MRTRQRLGNLSTPTVACTLIAFATSVQPPVPEAQSGDAMGPVNGRTTGKSRVIGIASQHAALPWLPQCLACHRRVLICSSLLRRVS
jgi:hypothetical protein